MKLFAPLTDLAYKNMARVKLHLIRFVDTKLHLYQCYIFWERSGRERLGLKR